MAAASPAYWVPYAPETLQVRVLFEQAKQTNG